MKKKRLIVFDGPYGTGKTFLAKHVSTRFDIPMIGKDEIKELLFDTLGAKGKAWSDRLDRPSFELMWWTAKKLLQQIDSLILETHFDAKDSREKIAEIANQANAEVLIIEVECEFSERVERCIRRVESGERHPGHCDAGRNVTLIWLRLAGLRNRLFGRKRRGDPRESSLAGIGRVVKVSTTGNTIPSILESEVSAFTKIREQ